MSEAIKISHKGLNAEQRIHEVTKWILHPAYEEFTEFHKENHQGLDPTLAAIKDMDHIIRNKDWDETGPHSAEEYLHPRYGRVMGHRTFYPFPDWLHHNSMELAQKNIRVELEYRNGTIFTNTLEMPKEKTTSKVTRLTLS